MSSKTTIELFSLLFLLASQVFADWTGNLLFDLLSVAEKSPIRALPAAIIGALFTAYIGEKLKKQVEKEPENLTSAGKNNTILSSTGLALTFVLS